jgi:hypothetical protein
MWKKINNHHWLCDECYSKKDKAKLIIKNLKQDIKFKKNHGNKYDILENKLKEYKKIYSSY